MSLGSGGAVQITKERLMEVLSRVNAEKNDLAQAKSEVELHLAQLAQENAQLKAVIAQENERQSDLFAKDREKLETEFEAMLSQQTEMAREQGVQLEVVLNEMKLALEAEESRANQFSSQAELARARSNELADLTGDLRAEIQSLQLELALVKEGDAHHANGGDISSELESTKRALARSNESLAQVDAEVNELRQRHADKISELQRRLEEAAEVAPLPPPPPAQWEADKQAEMEALEKKFLAEEYAKEFEMDGLKQQLAAGQAELDRLRKECDAAKQRSTTQEEQIADQLAERDARIAELEERGAAADLAKLREEVAALEQLRAEEDQAHAAVLAGKDAELGQLTLQLERAEQASAAALTAAQTEIDALYQLHGEDAALLASNDVELARAEEAASLKLAELREEIGTLKQQHTNDADLLASKDADLAELTLNLARAEEAAASTSSSSSLELAELQAEIATLKQQHADDADLLASKDAELKSAQEAASSSSSSSWEEEQLLREEMAALEQLREEEVQAHAALLAGKDAELGLLAAKLERATEHASAAASLALQAEIDALKQQRADDATLLAGKHAEQTNEIAGLKEDLAVAERERGELRALLSAAAVTDEENNRKKEFDEFQQRAELAHLAMLQLREQVASAKAEALASCAKEEQALKQELAALQRAKDEESAALHQRIATLLEEAQQQQQQPVGSSSATADTSELTRLQTEVARLEAQKQGFAQSLAEVEHQTEQFERRLREERHRLQDERGRTAALQEELQGANERFESMLRGEPGPWVAHGEEDEDMPVPTHLTLDSPVIQTILLAWTRDKDNLAFFNAWCRHILMRGELLTVQRGVELNKCTTQVKDGILSMLVPMLRAARRGITISVFTRERVQVQYDVRLRVNLPTEEDA